MSNKNKKGDYSNRQSYAAKIWMQFIKKVAEEDLVDRVDYAIEGVFQETMDEAFMEQNSFFRTTYETIFEAKSIELEQAIDAAMYEFIKFDDADIDETFQMHAIGYLEYLHNKKRVKH